MNLRALALTISLSFLSPVAFGQVIDYQTKIVLDGKSLTKEVSVSLIINDVEEKYLSQISIPFSKTDQLSIKSAEIYDSKNQLVKSLKKREVITTSDISSGSFFEDDYKKEFNLSWGTYPYIIKYSYKHTTKRFIHLAYWLPYYRTHLFHHKSEFTLEIPKDENIKLDHSDELSIQEEINDKTISYTIKTEDLNPLEKEDFAPAVIDQIPYIHFVQEDFKYDVEGSTRSWKGFGDWIHRLIVGLDELTAEEKRKVDKLIAGIEDHKKIVEILYKYLQDNTRYVNVSIDFGGFKPYPATYVCENKYGDCKALTIYMKALLKYAGIESYYTIIRAGREKVRINPDFPSQQFNHVILCVPLENDTLWLEKTNSNIPFNYVGTFINDRPALLTHKDSSVLIQMPKLSQDDVKEEYTYDIDMSKRANVKAKLNFKLKGAAYEVYTSWFRSYKEELVYKELIKDLNIKNFDVNEREFKINSDDQPIIELKFEIEAKDLIRDIGSELLVKNFLTEYKVSKNTARTEIVQIDYPIYKVYDLNYTFAEDQIVDPSSLESKKIESKFGTLIIDHSYEENTLNQHISFYLKAGQYPPSSYSELYEFMREYKKIIKQTSFIIKTNN